jgi:phytoene dehydrogenase-like protein
VSSQPDAIVIGSGPNGLAAAIRLATAGLEVVVYEAQEQVGGAARSLPLTLPGFVHDFGSAVHPFAVVSPAFRKLPLAQHGLEWIEPPAMLAHPFDDGSAATVVRSVRDTARGLGPDSDAYARVFGQLVADWPALERAVLGPISIPHRPFAVGRFGLRALRSADAVARSLFQGRNARGLFAGVAAHGAVPLEMMPTAAFALVLTALAHIAGWVMPRGGAQSIANALAAHFKSLGGQIVCGSPVASIDDLPPARAILCDLTPRPLLRVAGHRFTEAYRRRLEAYRYGAASFKVDWALDAPIPWRSADCARAATVHLGGTLEEIALSERQAWTGRPPERPYVLLVQPTLFDPSRAPAGRHVVWTYCHTPHASTADLLPAIEAQIERYAPGFRDRVLARSVLSPAGLERCNANLVGGDIAGGASTLWNLALRNWWGYRTPVRGLYVCSSSTPPGVGVHGMCGDRAARLALDEIFPDARQT